MTSEKKLRPQSLVDYLFGPGIDEPIAVSEGGAVHYPLVDGLGSVAGLASSGGEVANQYTYDAWGVTRSQSGTVSNAFGYTSREFGEAGLSFYRARFYSQDSGRFLSEDPIGLIAGPTLYAYVENSPTQLTDPEGLCAWEVHSRPTRSVPHNRNTRHRYFYNRQTKQAVGLTTNEPVKASVSPWGSPGKWERREDHKNPLHRKDEEVSDESCDCVNKKTRNPSSPPRYCTVPQRLPKRGFPQCHNCQSWVDQVLSDCQ